MSEKQLDEKLDPSQGAGEYIKDFQQSDAPQFQGKSKEKRRVMALAAYMDAKRQMKEQAPVAPSLVKHRISVTVSDPNHTAVSKRDEKIQKTVIVTHSDDKAGAQKVGEKFYKKKGYRVHDSHHVGVVNESTDTVTKDKDGKVVSWKHEGDWKKNDAKKNPEGKVHNLAGQALKKTQEMNKEETELEEGVNKSDVPAYLRKKTGDKLTTQDLEKERTQNRSHPETIKKINGTQNEEVEHIDELNASTLKSYIKKNIDSGRSETSKGDTGLYSATKKHAEKLSTTTLNNKVKKLGNTPADAHKNPYEYEASRTALKDRGTNRFAGSVRKEEVEQLEEANHREFASQGKMHPDMAKHMTVGNHMDYYEPKTGDKVHGKVIHKDGKEVHIRQTHDSYDSKKTGSLHKFTISTKLDEGIYDAIRSKIAKGRPAEDVAKDIKQTYGVDKSKLIKKATKLKQKSLSREEFENGEFEQMTKSYKQFVEEINEVKMADLPSRKISGHSYGAQYHDPEGDDDADDKPKAKPADAPKRGRGRPAGSKSGARQIGSGAKKRSGVEYTGYPLHLPNSNK